MSKNIDYDLILSQAQEIVNLRKKSVKEKDFNEEEFIKNIKETYPNLYENQKSIFTLCTTNGMDINRLKYMIEMIKKMNRGAISEHNASIEVGKRLVDDIIKPNLPDKK